MPASDGCGRVVPVSEHEEQDIARKKPVALPGAFDREGPALRIDTRDGCVLAQRVAPFTEPGAGAMVVVRSIVVPRHVVDLLAPVFRHSPVLANQFSPVFVAGRGLVSGEVAGIDHDVPIECRGSFLQSFRLPNCLGQALTAAADVGGHMRAACCPHAKQARRRLCLGRRNEDKEGRE